MEFFRRPLQTALMVVSCSFYLYSCGNSTHEELSGDFSFLGFKPALASSSSLEPYDYVSYIDEKDNGLHVNKSFDDLGFSVSYKPANYLVVKELKQKEISSAEYKPVYKGYKDMQYFLLSVTNKAGETDVIKYKISTPAAYSERLKYFSFGMERDLKLVEGADTIPCSMVLYERSYGISRQANFMIAFPVRDTAAVSDKTVLFDDKVFGMGMLKFNISGASIHAIPQLDIL